MGIYQLESLHNRDVFSSLKFTRLPWSTSSSRTNAQHQLLQSALSAGRLHGRHARFRYSLDASQPYPIYLPVQLFTRMDFPKLQSPRLPLGYWRVLRRRGDSMGKHAV